MATKKAPAKASLAASLLKALSSSKRPKASKPTKAAKTSHLAGAKARGRQVQAKRDKRG